MGNTLIQYIGFCMKGLNVCKIYKWVGHPQTFLLNSYILISLVNAYETFQLDFCKHLIPNITFEVEVALIKTMKIFCSLYI